MNVDILPLKIISGGQTGVDRAALDLAIELAIPHSGWCPSGRLAEDGAIDSIYQLKETTESDYITRTKLNVRDSDGTLVLNRGRLQGGTAATVRLANEMNKPCLIIDLNYPPGNREFFDWITINNIHVLNIAGPRESKRPEIYRQAKDILFSWFSGQNFASVQAR